MKIDTAHLFTAAVAGLFAGTVSGTAMASQGVGMQGDHTSPSGLNGCGGKDGCGSKDESKDDDQGKSEDKASCGGKDESKDDDQGKSEDKAACGSKDGCGGK